MRSGPTSVTRARKAPAVGIIGLLIQLGAEPPDPDTATAVRAWSRGNASEGQQRRAFQYVAAELCGVGRSPFTGDAEGTAFRTGAHAVGIALCGIADARVAHVPLVVAETSEG